MINVHSLKRQIKFFSATYAYERMATVETYLNSIITVADIQDDIINHLPSLIRILGKNDCKVSIADLLVTIQKIVSIFQFSISIS